MHEIRSLADAQREFSTQHKCEEYLARMRWPDGVRCPRCGRDHQHHMPKYRKWYCKHCDYQYSVTAGTIFHGTKLPLTKWMVAVWFLCHSPKGCSAKQLERILGVCYETAWSMAHRIREAMANDVNMRMLSGEIELDAAVVRADGGRATGNVPYNTKDVLGIVERGGALRLFVLKRLARRNIEHVVMRTVEDVEVIYSDMCSKLGFLGYYFPHERVNHWLSHVDGRAHVNHCENVFSLFKRGLRGLFHHVSAKWLQCYLDAFAFRYSHRNERGSLLDLVLANCERIIPKPPVLAAKGIT